MFAKICGTTNLADAQMAVALGADALGFIFAPSKRHVEVAEVAAITAQLPAELEKVGVFTEANAGEISGAVLGAGLNAVQMHWAYGRGAVDSLRRALGVTVRLWQVVGYDVQPSDPLAAEQAFVQTLAAAFLDDNLDRVLVDSVATHGERKNSGGLGLAFPWGRASELIAAARGEAARRAPAQPLRPLALAGGLNPENVAEAARILQPWGVDVVSGVESHPGQKHPDKLQAFLRAVRQPS